MTGRTPTQYRRGRATDECRCARDGCGENPPNLAILSLENRHYGETMYQESQRATGSILRRSRPVQKKPIASEQVSPMVCWRTQASPLSYASRQPAHPLKRNMDPVACRNRFRAALSAPLNIRGLAPSSRAPPPLRVPQDHLGPGCGRAFRPPVAAERKPRLDVLLARGLQRDFPLS